MAMFVCCVQWMAMCVYFMYNYNNVQPCLNVSVLDGYVCVLYVLHSHVCGLCVMDGCAQSEVVAAIQSWGAPVGR